ncbi:Peroxide stress-activated histidine kinase mak1 [Ceratocystis platani]|uniref:Peroxide stress-activated histidine kinase mak1 n=1 Tax=Ceratocystis fimbriata f. sp. platani TaxID=88771 RepID=A0A0F8D1X7_CERFI|nr:Peroxide stress-activated histidine kinase mak1 [Ceratocystis platani]
MTAKNILKHGDTLCARETNSLEQIAYTAEVRLRSKKDEYRWHLVRWVEIENINSVKTGVYFGSATDINDQKLLEEKLKEAMESKSRFLSNMSHEIRTPLIGISGMITFLHDTRLTEEQQDYANTIQNSANSLLLIINDILDLSKASAGMMRLSYEWFHTRSLIEDVNELVSTMAIHKGLELNYVVDETVPAWVKGDKVRIRQVLLNVIGNAIKFTTVGEVFSRCRVFVDPEAETTKGKKGVVNAKDIMLEFIVIDTGRGFSEKEAELIFKPFSQIDGSSTRQHGGSGLGLVISRQLVELHGGEMVGQAVPNKGSQFSFTARFALPSADDYPDVNTQAARASGADELEENRPESPKPKKSSTPPPPIAITMPLPPPQTYSILILCPQDHSREATSQHIEMTLPKGPPHKIRALPSADAVLEMVASQNPGPFTHVVLNVGAASNVVSTMDRIDQLECISNSTILALCDTVQRQVLMRLSPQEQPRLIRTGKVNFINKPLRPSRFATIFDPDRLRDLSIDRNRSSAERHWENQRAHYTEVGKIIGNRGYRVLLVEDNPVNRKVLTKFLEKMNVEAVVAVDGQECTEKIMAQPQGYYNMVLCDLHMPRKDGYQACQDVRAWEKRTGASPMPFIALSANVMPEVQDRCSQSGFTDYITKPVDFVKLSRTMAKFF